MNLPKQVVEQSAHAERLMKEMLGNTSPEATNKEVENEVKNEVDKNVEGEVNNKVEGEVNNKDGLNVENEVVKEVVNEVENKVENATPQEAAINWEERAKKAEARYQVLQGKYNKEIVEVRKQGNTEEVQSLRQTIDDLNQTITELRQQPAMTPPAPDADLDQLREDYGSELVDGVMSAMRKELSGQVQQVQQSVQQSTSVTNRTLLEQKLSARGIDFAQVDSDPLFHDWLAKYDANTGVQRQQQLVDSFRNGQLEATAAMYVEYVNGSPTQTPHVQQSSFEQHVQPQTKAPVQQAPEPRPMFSPQQIQEFYTNKRKGMYTAEEADRIEREIYNSLKN